MILGTSRPREHSELPQDTDRTASPGRPFRFLRMEPGGKLDPRFRARLLDMTSRVREARMSYDAQPIVECLAENAVYEFQDILTPLTGRANVASYLEQRFAAIRDMTATRPDLDIHLGEVPLPQGADYPCLIFSQEGAHRALWVIRLNGEDRVSRLDVLTVAPPPDATRRLSG